MNMEQSYEMGVLNMPQEEAYKRLKEISGEDFPINDYAWYDWYLSHHDGEIILCPFDILLKYVIKANLYRLMKPFRRK